MQQKLTKPQCKQRKYLNSLKKKPKQCTFVKGCVCFAHRFSDFKGAILTVPMQNDPFWVLYIT